MRPTGRPAGLGRASVRRLSAGLGAVATVLAVGLCACGTNRPEIPAGLLGVCESTDAGGYPAGPYGTEEGDLVGDLSFMGWRDPSAVGYEGDLVKIAFSDYYDPTGKSYEVLLVNTCAGWCLACRDEHRTLPAFYSQWAPEGLVIISAYFQNALRDPPSVADLSAWTMASASNFPMVLDPDFQMQAYASADSAPLNLVVDARTMRILKKVLGNQPEVINPFIESVLTARGPG